MDIGHEHQARSQNLYSLWKVCMFVCVQAKTVCRYLRSETIISTALYIIKKIPSCSISWLFSTNRRSFYRRLVSLGLNISSLNASRPKKENTYIMMINRDKRDMHHGRISRVRLNSHPLITFTVELLLILVLASSYYGLVTVKIRILNSLVASEREKRGGAISRKAPINKFTKNCDYHLSFNLLKKSDKIKSDLQIPSN